jgi:ATP/maltotriose-dependent transcriptional regulator MalT
LSGLAWVALASGHAGRVEPLLDEATLALGNAGPWFLSLVAYLRAVAMVRRGDADRAIALVRESLERILDLHDRFAFVYAFVPLAVAAALKGEDAWAARIMGARDSATERIGSALVDQSVDDLKVQAERDVRARLGPDGWKRAYEAGRIASLDAVLKDIDAVRGPR